MDKRESLDDIVNKVAPLGIWGLTLIVELMEGESGRNAIKKVAALMSSPNPRSIVVPPLGVYLLNKSQISEAAKILEHNLRTYGGITIFNVVVSEIYRNGITKDMLKNETHRRIPQNSIYKKICDMLDLA